jgi:4-hydroxy-3-methylbut-2-en-1-yl diphosphate synthase IspG/GcpE
MESLRGCDFNFVSIAPSRDKEIGVATCVLVNEGQIYRLTCYLSLRCPVCGNNRFLLNVGQYLQTYVAIYSNTTEFSPT